MTEFSIERSEDYEALIITSAQQPEGLSKKIKCTIQRNWDPAVLDTINRVIPFVDRQSQAFLLDVVTSFIGCKPVSVLTELLDPANPDLSELVIRSLIRMDSHIARETLIQVIENEKYPVSLRILSIKGFRGRRTQSQLRYLMEKFLNVPQLEKFPQWKDSDNFDDYDYYFMMLSEVMQSLADNTSIYLSSRFQDILSTQPTGTRFRIVRIMWLSSLFPAIDVLISLIDDENDEVRWEAIYALSQKQARIREADMRISELRERAFQELTNVAKHGEFPPSLMLAMGEFGDERLVDIIREKLSGGNSPVNEYAIIALGKLHSEKAVDILLEQLYSKEMNEYKYVIEALIEIGSSRAIQGVISYLTSMRRDEIRIELMNKIWKIKTKNSIPALIRNINHSDPDVREACTIALGNLRHPLSFMCLVDRLSVEEDQFVIKSLTAALSKGVDIELISDRDSFANNLIHILADGKPTIVPNILKGIESSDCDCLSASFFGAIYDLISTINDHRTIIMAIDLLAVSKRRESAAFLSVLLYQEQFHGYRKYILRALGTLGYPEYFRLMLKSVEEALRFSSSLENIKFLEELYQLRSSPFAILAINSLSKQFGIRVMPDGYVIMENGRKLSIRKFLASNFR